ncbi:MAG: hypothetical protein JKY56_10115 [Kofleriaceae bacterium]|nr:hypothetical protein [Kofleriaceae bacterium]
MHKTVQMLIKYSLLLLIACSACVSEGPPVTPFEPSDPCVEVKQYIAEDCVIDNSFIASAECDPLTIGELLVEACPELASGETDLQLCELGISANCPTEELPELPVEPECSSYIELDGQDACSYYLCKEQQIGEDERCGDSGYYTDYGYKYCNLFQETAKERLSPEGVEWVNQVMPCLMYAIEDEVGDTDSCDEILETAFDSHPECYVDAGFCELPWEDMAWVFLTVELSDFDFQQVLITGIGCLSEWR